MVEGPSAKWRVAAGTRILTQNIYHSRWLGRTPEGASKPIPRKCRKGRVREKEIAFRYLRWEFRICIRCTYGHAHTGTGHAKGKRGARERCKHLLFYLLLAQVVLDNAAGDQSKQMKELSARKSDFQADTGVFEPQKNFHQYFKRKRFKSILSWC